MFVMIIVIVMLFFIEWEKVLNVMFAIIYKIIIFM